MESSQVGRETLKTTNEIDAQVERLGNENSHTSDLINALGSRLSAVLKPQVPAPPDPRANKLEGVQREPQSSLGCSIGSQAGMAQVNRLMLQDILNRLVL